jgi:hypothetical protein
MLVIHTRCPHATRPCRRPARNDTRRDPSRPGVPPTSPRCAAPLRTCVALSWRPSAHQELARAAPHAARAKAGPGPPRVEARPRLGTALSRPCVLKAEAVASADLNRILVLRVLFAAAARRIGMATECARSMRRRGTSLWDGSIMMEGGTPCSSWDMQCSCHCR